MPQASKTFRILVSSTFSDLKAERNALQEHVFPSLERGRALLEQWYRRDDNAVPPLFFLQPREREFTDPGVWDETERELRSVLLEAVEKIPLSSDQQLKYVSSTTEQEIAQGALQVSDATEHAFWMCSFGVDSPSRLVGKP